MNEMNITSAQYKEFEGKNSSITITIGDSEILHIPIAEGNRHYDEIMRQVEAGTLTIQEAE